MPRECYMMLREEIKRGNIVTDLSKLEKEIIYNLRRMSQQEIANLPDVSEGLDKSIKVSANSCNNFNSLINIIKSKRFTRYKNSKNIII